MTVKFLDNFEALGEKAWESLLAKAPTRTLFQTYAWQRAWWRSRPVGAGMSLCLAAGYENGQLRVIAPLYLREKVLRFIGDGHVSRLDLIYDASRAGDIDALWGPLRARHDWQRLELSVIPDDSPTWRALKAGSRDAGLYPVCVQKVPLWGIIFEGRHEKVRRALLCGAVAKHAAVFAAKGRMSCRHQAAPSAEELPLREVVSQYLHRWSASPHPALLSSRAERDLVRELAADPFLRPRLVLSILAWNGKESAFHLGFIHERVFYWYIPAFDVALKRFSPEEALWKEVLGYALERGCRQVVCASSREPVVRRYAERAGQARTVKVLRSRRDMLAAKAWREFLRLPMALPLRALLREAGRCLGVLFFRRRMVVQARRGVEGVTSFTTLYEGGAMGVPAAFMSRMESELARRLRPDLAAMRMLDLGVGAGARTGLYFAPLVRAYTAVDHSGRQVASAREQLDDIIPADQVRQAEASDMAFAPDRSFDLILFSGEGIDECGEAERLNILREMRRVGAEGAVVFFTSRNLQGLTLRAGRDPADLLRRWRRRMLMAAANENLKRLRHQGAAMLLAEGGRYRVAEHYVTPREQVRVLKELGFHDVRVFSSVSGLEVRDWRLWDKLADDVLGYLCRV